MFQAWLQVILQVLLIFPLPKTWFELLKPKPYMYTNMRKCRATIFFCGSLQYIEFAFRKANHHLTRPSVRHRAASHNTSHRPKYGFDIPWKSVQSKWKPDGIYIYIYACVFIVRCVPSFILPCYFEASSGAKFTAAGWFIVIHVHTHASIALSKPCLFSVSYLALFLGKRKKKLNSSARDSKHLSFNTRKQLIESV